MLWTFSAMHCLIPIYERVVRSRLFFSFFLLFLDILNLILHLKKTVRKRRKKIKSCVLVQLWIFFCCCSSSWIRHTKNTLYCMIKSRLLRERERVRQAARREAEPSALAPVSVAKCELNIEHVPFNAIEWTEKLSLCVLLLIIKQKSAPAYEHRRKKIEKRVAQHIRSIMLLFENHRLSTRIIELGNINDRWERREVRLLSWLRLCCVLAVARDMQKNKTLEFKFSGKLAAQELHSRKKKRKVERNKQQLFGAFAALRERHNNRPEIQIW